MVNRLIDFSSAAGDLRFQYDDPVSQLIDREGVEVLRDQLHQRIARPFGQDVIQIHSAMLDPNAPRVNWAKAAKLGMTVIELPETMIAIDPEAPGGPEVLRPVERPVPKPAPGEVLIKVAAAGVNRPDVLQRKGGYPPPPGAPSILGLEVAGEVVGANGFAEEALIGQPVCALIAGGGYAEYAVAPAGSCLVVPEALSMIEAAAIPETLFTVWINMFERAFAAEGDTVLVHGGTSGIGTMAIALAKLFGIRILVTCGSDEKCARAVELGADLALNYKTQDWVAEVKAATEGRGVQAVIDMVGGDYLPRNLQCLADEGRHVSIAVQRGMTAEIPIFEIMRRRLTLTGSTLRARPADFKRMVADELDRMVWPHVRDGRLKPVIDTVLPLAEAAQAHARMEAGDHVGKIVLTVA
jgi:putative PIG3 family NAD(P)H quinone oxidoreductase